MNDTAVTPLHDAITAGIATAKYKRILLKLSGEALMGDDPYGINRAVIDRIVAEIGDIASLGVQVGVVIGGGNAKQLKELPPGTRRGHNLTAFRGGFRLWSVDDVWVLAAIGGETAEPTTQEALRVL